MKKGKNISPLFFPFFKRNERNNTNSNKCWKFCYVLLCMVVTRDTAHFERSLLNADAALNAVQIIQWQDYNNGKKSDKEPIHKKEEENWK